METIWTRNGYDGRKHYLTCLSESMGIDLETVLNLAAVLGASEDFDGLITSLEDYEAGY